MTETEKQIINDLRPRLDNWRFVYRDRVVRNISITYAVEKALLMTRDKTDFSLDYVNPEEVYNQSRIIDYRDADFLNDVWRNLSTENTAVLSVGTHGLNVRTAKLIILLYTFGGIKELKRAGRAIWHIKDKKLDYWIDDALLFFALRIRFLEKTKKITKEVNQ